MIALHVILGLWHEWLIRADECSITIHVCIDDSQPRELPFYLVLGPPSVEVTSSSSRSLKGLELREKALPSSMLSLGAVVQYCGLVRKR